MTWQGGRRPGRGTGSGPVRLAGNPVAPRGAPCQASNQVRAPAAGVTGG
jgi:hypothetical protein